MFAYWPIKSYVQFTPDWRPSFTGNRLKFETAYVSKRATQTPEAVSPPTQATATNIITKPLRTPFIFDS